MSLLTAGVDEVGRGALAGPVVAAAVVLGSVAIPGIKDSKKLSSRKREKLFSEILEKAVDVGIGTAGVKEIDELNIHNASLLAMSRAVYELRSTPDLVLVDGKFTPVLECQARAIINGDNCELNIAAASIVAKVYRDRFMVSLDKKHPRYGFAEHKGYPTKAHKSALQKLGAIPQHRLTFSPVNKLYQKGDCENT